MQPLQSSISIPPSSLTTTPQRPKHTQRKRRKDQLHSIPEDETALDMSDDNTVTVTAPPSGALDAITTPTPSLPSQSTPTSKSKSRKQDSSTNIFLQQHLTKRRSSLKSASRGLSADARVEHLLLAARKVGKERASILSGMLQQLEERERERERERRQEEFMASTAAGITPKTPKRGSAATGGAGAGTGTGITYPGYSLPTEAGYLYVSTPSLRPPTTQTHGTATAVGSDSGAASATVAGTSSGTGGAGIHPMPVLIPAYSHPIFQTPTSSTLATPTANAGAPGTSTTSGASGPSGPSSKQRRDSRTQNPQTPLDSLLSAARSMMRSGTAATNTGGNAGDADQHDPHIHESLQTTGSRRSVLALHDDDIAVPESPLPKRRKLASREDVGDIPALPMTGNTATGRVRSALDVLADQAAAFSSQEVGSRATMVGAGMYSSSSREGKERESVQEDDTHALGLSSSRKEKGKEREKTRGDGLEMASEEHTENEATGSEKDNGRRRKNKTKSQRRGSGVDEPSSARSWTPGSVNGGSSGSRGGMKDGSIEDGSREGSTQNGSRALMDGSRADVPGDPGEGEDVTTPKPPPLVRSEHGEVSSATLMTHPSPSTLTPVHGPAPLPTAPAALAPQTLSQTQLHAQSIPVSTPHTHISALFTATPSASASSRESSPLDLYTRGRESQQSESGTALSVNGTAADGGTPVAVLSGTASGSLIHTEDDGSSTQSTSAAPTQPAGGVSSQTRSDTSAQTASITSTQTARNKTVARVANQDSATTQSPTKRQRSPYMKWSKEEDELLTQAVAKYGQKWDLVQKALPSRGYHQVRQRWLRKLGVFDTKPDLSSFQTSSLASPLMSSAASGPGIGNGPTTLSEPPPNPKLGLAPLSSELVFSSSPLVGRGGGGRGGRVP
ncbi:hypothetical protein EDD16DRAFT_575377 [Pisolithus croceorrhizus]|nr:hypothetical protein EDD16DRAFT_575377 [Pisolithus croceorrhizus]